MERKKQSWFSRMKQQIKSLRHSSNPVVRFLVEGLFDLATARHTLKGLLTSKQARSVFWTKLFRRKQVHQTTPATALNRFPVIFSACRDYLGNGDGLKILSFGCATGEEVITLRHYFPRATIVGAEINKYSLEVCRKRQLDDRMIFIESTAENIQRNGPYDAIFCMAVFQRTPELIAQKRITDLSRIYPFSKFEQTVCELSSSVKPGGLMVVHFSQYDFQDTRVADQYQPLGDYSQGRYGPVFDKNSKLVTTPHSRKSIFIKDAELLELSRQIIDKNREAYQALK